MIGCVGLGLRGAKATGPAFKKWLVLFAVFSAVEWTWLLFPVNMMAPIPDELVALLTRVRETPGDRVLDLPFCVAGGNGVCTTEQCPQYPVSTVGSCLRQWHDKAVYGLYQSRMLESHCQIYRKEPYTSWFRAWREQRCFTASEWDSFCDYLEHSDGIAATFVYPDIWVGAARPECQKEFERRLGPPISTTRFLSAPTRGGRGERPTRLWWFGSKCIKSGDSFP